MKKRLLSSLLCVVLMVSVMSQVSFTARADISNMCGEEATWTLNDIGDLFILGNGVMYDYTRNSAPWNVKNVVNIAVVEGVKGIGKYAFCDCMCLKSAEIAESVEYINSGAFYNCHSMTDIILPKYMSSIGDVAFSGCSSLKSIVIPKGVATIKPGTFSSCTSLKSIVIPYLQEVYYQIL